RAVAAAQTAHLLDLDAVLALERAARAIAEVRAAREPARDVAAERDRDARRRGAPEVRVERGHALQAVERHAQPLGERVLFSRRGVAAGGTEAVQLVDDAGPPPRVAQRAFASLTSGRASCI